MTAASFRVRAPLRCDGIGRLDCAEDAAGARLAVRWLPLEANGEQAVKACERLPEHPTLPRIRETGTQDGKAFVALDFPEGQLLSARQGERLGLHEVIAFARQLADALACVHEQNVVHGELGSESVLLADGKAFLWDMPLVITNRLTDRRGESRLMHNLGRMGPYLAPERARGAGASKESDVYSLAAILCIAAGAPLPTEKSTLGMVHQVATGAWAPKVPPFVPEPWASMLERMLSADAARRPTAQEAARAFAHEPAVGLPTVPEMQALQLPASVLAAAAEQAKQQVAKLEAQPSAPEASAAAVAAPASAPALASAPAVEPSKPAVQLTDTIAVHAELAERATVTTGATTAPKASAEKKRAQPPSPAKVPYLLIGGLAFGIITLLSAAVVLAVHEPVARPPSRPEPALPAPAVVSPPPAPALLVPVAAPAPAAAMEQAPAEEEIAPLPSPAKKPSRAAAPKAQPAPAAKKSADPEVKAEATPHAATQPSAAADFSFLGE